MAGAPGASRGGAVRVARATAAGRALPGRAGARAPPPGAVRVVILVVVVPVPTPLPVVGSVAVVAATSLVAPPGVVSTRASTVVVRPAEATVIAPEATVVLVVPGGVVPAVGGGVGPGARARPGTGRGCGLEGDAVAMTSS